MFERIYLHTAAVPTSAASVLAKDDVLEVPEAPAGADAEGGGRCLAEWFWR